MVEKMENLNECPHIWSMWCPYDPMIIGMGITNNFCYHRECEVLGYKARQRVKNLVPVGEVEEFIQEDK